jgi:hypothetical protein
MILSLTINNIIALLIHAVITTIMIAVILIPELSLTPLTKWIWACSGLLLYLLAGFIFSGSILLRNRRMWINFLSLSVIILIGAAVWFYCMTHPANMLPGIEWILFVYVLPFYLPFHDSGLIDSGPWMIVFIFVPTILIWIGMEMRCLLQSNK